jgi:hypothetical protein
MSKKITFISILAILFFTCLTPLVQAQTVDVDATGAGLNQTANNITAFKGQVIGIYGSAYIASEAGKIVGIALSFIGVLFLGLMIYAGIMWMTAQGNEQQVTKAKDLIVNCVIGLIIVFAAYALTVYIGQNFLQ